MLRRAFKPVRMLSTIHYYCFAGRKLTFVTHQANNIRLHGQHLVNPTRLSAWAPYFECVYPTVNWGVPSLNLVGSRGVGRAGDTPKILAMLASVFRQPHQQPRTLNHLQHQPSPPPTTLACQIKDSIPRYHSTFLPPSKQSKQATTKPITMVRRAPEKNPRGENPSTDGIRHPLGIAPQSSHNRQTTHPILTIPGSSRRSPKPRPRGRSP